MVCTSANPTKGGSTHWLAGTYNGEPGATGGNHYHTVEFQFVYILKGWQRMRIDGVGELTVREGSSWIQPPGIRHEVLEYSDDREALEIILPAKYDTTTD